MQLHQLPLCLLSLFALTSALSHPDLYARSPDPGPSLPHRPAPHNADPLSPSPGRAAHHPLHPRGTILSTPAADVAPTCVGTAKEYCEQRCLCRTANGHLYCDRLSSEWEGARKLHLRRQLVAFCAPACRCAAGKGVEGGTVEGEGSGGKEGKEGRGRGSGGEGRDRGVFGVMAF